MNFERILNKILFKIFSNNNLFFIFGILLVFLFINILYNNSNLIEGNTSSKTSFASQMNKNINNKIINGNKKTTNTMKNIENENNRGAHIVDDMIENFIENMDTNMDCSDTNFFNSDKKNTASKLVNNACLIQKKIKQENNV